MVLKTKTYFPKADKDIQWYVVDAEGQILGRLASQIAQVLRGKHDPRFTPHADLGFRVAVVNAEKVKPETIITNAVKGMLPKGSLGRQLMKGLKVYTGPSHPHQAQQPEVLTF